MPPPDRPDEAPAPPSDIAEPPQDIPPASEHSDSEPSLPKQAFATQALAEQAWASDRTSISTAGSFAYSKNHPATPLAALSLAAMAGTDDWSADDRNIFDERHDTPR